MNTTHYLKPLTFSVYATFALGLLIWANLAMAQDAPTIIYQPNPDSPIGMRNENGPPELAQYDFLIGDWDVAITWYLPGQEPSKSNAKWHNHWIIDGRVVMLEWRGPQFTGAEIRQWHPGQKKWVGVNVYPDFGGGLNEVTAEFIDGKMYVTIPTVGPNGPFISRETYYDIEPDSYKMKAEHSFDDGETWERGLYEMTVWRTED